MLSGREWRSFGWGLIVWKSQDKMSVRQPIEDMGKKIKVYK